MNSVVAFACLVLYSHFQLDFSTMIRQGVKRTNHETMNVLHNCMTPEDGPLTIPFLDVSVLTSASLTMLALKPTVSLLLDSLLPREATDFFFFYNSEQLDIFPDQAAPCGQNWKYFPALQSCYTGTFFFPQYGSPALNGCSTNFKGLLDISLCSRLERNQMEKFLSGVNIMETWGLIIVSWQTLSSLQCWVPP